MFGVARADFNRFQPFLTRRSAALRAAARTMEENPRNNLAELSRYGAAAVRRAALRQYWRDVPRKKEETNDNSCVVTASRYVDFVCGCSGTAQRILPAGQEMEAGASRVLSDVR